MGTGGGSAEALSGVSVMAGGDASIDARQAHVDADAGVAGGVGAHFGAGATLNYAQLLDKHRR